MNIKSFRFNVVAMLACIITIGCLLLGNILSVPLPVLAYNSGCSLEVKSGDVEVQDFGSITWKKVVGDTSLQAGDKVKTTLDANATITFLDGSTMDIGPDTYILIQQVDYSNNKSVVTIVSQFWGRTWNRVVKMVNSGSRYEIFTPSSHAAVRGTYFMVDASLTGATTVQTVQGLVAVNAQNITVLVQPDHSVTVNHGEAPPTPSKSQGAGSNAGGNSAGSNAGGNSGGSNAGGNSAGSNAGGNSAGSNAGGNSAGSNAGGNSAGSNAGGNSAGSNAGGNSAGSNAGGNSAGSNAGGNSAGSNAGGNSAGSNAGGNSGSSNAGGTSADSNAGGNSGGSNAGGNSAGSNAGGNSAGSNAGGNSAGSNAGGNSAGSNAGGNSAGSNAGGNSGGNGGGKK